MTTTWTENAVQLYREDAFVRQKMFVGPFVLQLSALKTRARQSPCELNFVEAWRTRALVLTSAALSPSSDIAVRRRLEAHTVGDGNMRGGEDLFFFSYNFEDRVRLAPE